MDSFKYKTGLIITVIFVLTALALPIKDLSERIRTSLNIYRVNYAPEKVYVHHDKPYYMAGEQLWFKAYVVNAASLKASERSGVLYVSLTDDQNKAVERLTLPIADGEAHGDFAIPDNLSEGVYRITAYTQWMRNFGEETFFQKEIYIMDQQEKVSSRTGELEPMVVDLQFFPEGGNLIAGIPNEVAFKAVNSNGYGLPISAVLFDEDGRKVLDFESIHAGMGSFVLQPENSKKYFAKLNFKDGQTVDYPLPEVLAAGYGIHMDEVSDPENILVKVFTNTEENHPMVLFGISGDKLLYVEKILSTPDRLFEKKILKSDFPNGTVRFTLAKESGEPVAERLVFVRHPDKKNLELSTDKAVYQPREEVRLSVEVLGDVEEHMSRLSMAVTADKLVHHPKDQENIQTYLLLSSDLKGHIESPGYYFESDDTERQQALRSLMMTQGWSRFDWNAMISQEFPKIEFVNETDLNIKGRLVRSNGDPVSKGEVLLYLKDRHQTFITVPTNEAGYFAFQGFYFKGNIEVVIQGSDHRGRREDVEVHMLESEGISTTINNRVSLPMEFTAQLPEDYVLNTQQQFRGIETEVWGMELNEFLLQEVVVEGRAQIIEPFRLHNQADVVLYRDQLPIAPTGNVLESLQGRVPGLQVIQSGRNEFRAVIRGQGPPLYLLDGMPITEGTMQSLNQFDISRIEILKSPGAVGIYGGRGGGGVIALYTDTGFVEEEVDADSVKYIIVHQVSGFDRVRQFYSPIYENIDYFDLPDLRSTIYWNPQISLKGNDKKELSFFTADTPGTYRVILEGMTEDGQPIYKETVFEVAMEE